MQKKFWDIHALHSTSTKAAREICYPVRLEELGEVRQSKSKK